MRAEESRAGASKSPVRVRRSRKIKIKPAESRASVKIIARMIRILRSLGVMANLNLDIVEGRVGEGLLAGGGMVVVDEEFALINTLR